MAKRTEKPSQPKNVVAQARGAGKGANERPANKVLWENFKSLAGAVVIYLVHEDALRRSVSHSLGQHDPDAARRRLAVREQAGLRAHDPVHELASPRLHAARITTTSSSSSRRIRPTRRADDPTPTLVKRLIGMPGDTLLHARRLLYLNGVAQRQGRFDELEGRRHNDAPRLRLAAQSRAQGHPGSAQPPAQPTHDNWGPLVIPANHYFMMGDNRYCSKDSRYWGIVPRENVRGRPMFVYYSYVPGPGNDDGPCSGRSATGRSRSSPTSAGDASATRFDSLASDGHFSLRL